jgi:integrase
MTGIKKTFKANKENNKIIENYLKFYKTTKPKSSEHTIRSKRQSLEKLSDFLEHNTKHKSLEEATEDDMLNFFNDRYYVPENSFNLIGLHIRPFYRWKLGLDKRTIPPNMKWFETTSKRAKLRNNDPHRKDKLLITGEDYNKMIGFYKDVYGQNNAIWETYYLSGFRPEELQSMTIGDVREDKDKVVWAACPKSKSYPRENPLPEYPENLMRYIGNHPLKDNKKAPLWFALKGSMNLKPLAMSTIENRFAYMRKELKLKPTLNIKSFRKTRATIFFSSDDPKINNDTFIGKYMGWSPTTVIYRRQEYNLTNKDDLKKAICKKPMRSKSYDTIAKELVEVNKYKKENEDLRKQLKDIRKVTNENRDEYLSLKDDLDFTIQYFEDIINKRIFVISNKSEIKKKIIESGVGKLYEDGKISKDEFINKETAILDNIYKEHKPNIKIKNVDDLRKFRNNMSGLVEELIN